MTAEPGEYAALRAECERHRRANLLRAVVDGLDPEWIGDAVSTNFDRVPWLVAEKFRAENERLRGLLRRVTECCERPDGVCLDKAEWWTPHSGSPS